MCDFASCGHLKMARIGTEQVGRPRIHDEVLIGDNRYVFEAGIDTFAEMLHSRFPESSTEISTFLSRMRDWMSPAAKASSVMFFRLKVPAVLAHVPSVRAFLQRTLGSVFYDLTQISAEDLVRQCGVEPGSELGSVLLGQYGDSGVRADKLSAVMHLGVMAHYVNGSTYPVGGSGAMPRKMNTVVRAAGGCSFVMASVESLLVKEGVAQGVVVREAGDEAGQGVKIYANDCVISSIGAVRSYKMLVPHIPAAAKAAIARIRDGTEYSVAFIFLFCGLDISAQPEYVTFYP